MRILDTHLHLVYPDRFSYPWLAGEPAIDKSWPVNAYFAEAESLGIEAALHMEVDVAEPDMLAETQFMQTVHPKVVGAIAACRPENADFPAYLDAVAALPHVKGLRRILHQAPDDLSQSELFAENVRRLATKRLNFDLCVRADQLPIGMALVDKAPQVQFILDHCGVPDAAGNGLDPWRAHIAELAKRPNIAAKVSGIVAYAGPDWTVADLRPYVEHIIESFGWDRVVWGSDHPVCTLTADLTRWVRATEDIISGASGEEKARLLHRNAAHFYHVGGH
jgi:predicted TIM-barrel fold metal-dependent hydrolase